MSRWRYFFKRVLLSIPVIIFGATITFALIRLGPLDPVSAILGTQYSPDAAAQIRRNLGLNKPLWAQYFQFMWELATFHLGRSWVVSPGTTANELISIYAPRTIFLGFWSVLIALFVGIPLGFYAGLNPNTISDYFASFGGIVWRAMPNFWLAIILVSLLSQTDQLIGWSWADWLVRTNIVTPPSLDFFTNPVEKLVDDPDRWFTALLRATKQTAPAALVLGSASMGNEMRIGRTAVLETINSNYVETARAKGVSNRTLVWKHVFRNALIPLVPIITGEAFLLLGGSVFVETVFAINGLGYLFFQAAINGDLPLIGTLMYIFILILVGTNILQDFLYTIIDPRVGYEG
jgi:peptide/nickel transport system permease protein